MTTIPQTAPQGARGTGQPVSAPHSSFPREEVMDVCAQWSPHLRMPAGLDARKVMAAIAAVESGGGDIRYIGHDCGPRHEPAYDAGGSVWRNSVRQQTLVRVYGAPGACSYGPWQLMLINCKNYTPAELTADLDKCADAFVDQFNTYVIGNRKATTLEQIGDVWNLGHIGPDPAYTDKLAAAYQALG